MLDNYILIGNPISHSLSPQIHQLFAIQTKQNLSYKSVLVEKNKLAQTIKNFFSQKNNCGMNITLPFKREVLTLCDKIDPIAQTSHAVNTIYKDCDNNLVGTNTDGLGLIADLQTLGINIKNKNILLLGSGGASYGIMQPLLNSGINRIFLTNRTSEKSLKLIENFDFSNKITYLDWENVVEPKTIGIKFDGVINATSLSMQEEFPSLNKNIFNSDISWSYDLFYSLKTPTRFLQFCKNCGIKNNHDGLGMLVEQAALAFYLWRKVKPNTEIVKQLLVKK